jgi:hypothetical protein
LIKSGLHCDVDVVKLHQQHGVELCRQTSPTSIAVATPVTVVVTMVPPSSSFLFSGGRWEAQGGWVDRVLVVSLMMSMMCFLFVLSPKIYFSFTLKNLNIGTSYFKISDFL